MITVSRCVCVTTVARCVCDNSIKVCVCVITVSVCVCVCDKSSKVCVCDTSSKVCLCDSSSKVCLCMCVYQSSHFGHFPFTHSKLLNKNLFSGLIVSHVINPCFSHSPGRTNDLPLVPFT